MRNGGNGRGRNWHAGNGGDPGVVRCAIYTRKSTDEGLDRDFNSLDAQREAAEAYIKSQAGTGWVLLPDRYDDGGFSGGTLERPAIQRLLADIEAGKVDRIVVYKIDRLSRSILDFARLAEVFEQNGVGIVSVTQQFDTSTSMGRLTMNMLLSFAQFEREMVSDRTRDKLRAARRRGNSQAAASSSATTAIPTAAAGHQRGRGRAGPGDLPAVPRDRDDHRRRRGAEAPGLDAEEVDHEDRPRVRRRRVRQIQPQAAPHEPRLHRGGRLRREHLPRRARGDRRPRDVGPRAGDPGRPQPGGGPHRKAVHGPTRRHPPMLGLRRCHVADLFAARKPAVQLLSVPKSRSQRLGFVPHEERLGD